MSLGLILGDEVRLTVGGEPIVLRPTLRAGIEALGLFDDFGTLLRKIDELDTLTVRRLAQIGSGTDVATLMYAAGVMGLAGVRSSLADYVLILANGGTRPSDVEDTDGETRASGATHHDYYARLFKIGTGWLGWTPEQTLDAPMPAILSAYAGRQDMLRSIFGGSENTSRSTIPLDEKVRMAMDHFGTTKVKRQ